MYRIDDGMPSGFLNIVKKEKKTRASHKSTTTDTTTIMPTHWLALLNGLDVFVNPNENKFDTN